jgi:amino acid adenylation domain-containing protein
MVKVNGQRVELEEINFQIQSQLGKKATVVVDALPLKTSSQSLTLVAFLCYREPRASSINGRDGLALHADDELSLQHVALQSVLEARLPRYMVPFMFIPIAEIPRTRNGKLDRNRMREEVLHLSESQMAQYSLQNIGKTAPETAAEVGLQTLWSEVLHRPVETFGLNDDFFRAGGDSFGAMKLVAAARARNMIITVPDIFKSPRLSDMALKLRMESRDGDSTTAQLFDLLPGLDPGILDTIKAEAAEQCGIQSQEIVDLYPCTALQEGLMALSTRLGKGAYKAQKVFRIRSDEFDISRFKAAWATVATSEAILRTRIINTKAAGTLQVVLNTGLEWYETEEDLDSYLRQDLKNPVAYGGALLRFALVNNANACYFVWSAHHAAYDGWSVSITLSQVRHVLTDMGMDFKPVPFKNFIRHLTQIDATAQSAFWESQFPENKTPPLSFPSVPIGYQAQTHETLKQSLSTRVKCADGLNITSSTILRAAWASVISKYSGHKDVVFGATLSGRTANVAGISTINGPTITTVPVRIELDLPGEMTVHQYLTAVQDQATDMMPFEQMGLQNIRRQSITARASLDSIANLLVIQPAGSESDQDLKGMEAVPRSLDEFDSYPLVLLCSLRDDGTTTLEVKYDQSIISRKQMHRIVRQYDFTLQQLCGKPYTRLSDVDAINPEDVNEILKWNGPLPETTKACIHHVIAARTEERPDAHAVCAWDGNFTYLELNSMSIRLAAHLQGLGVGPEVKVGLCFEKSKWNVVAMLSVLQAGGTYTQLNPSNSGPMIKSILDDLGASTILCSSSQASLLADVVQSVLILDSNFIDHLPVPLEPVRSNSRPDSTAFIVNTSGSTGKPKSVIVEHRGFCSMAQYQAPRLGIGRNTRTLQFAAHWFDISNADAFITLMRGGCVCIPSEDERLSNLAGAINKYQVNWATMVPTAAAILQPDEVPTLKHLSLGGEPIRPDLHLRWSRHVVLMNSYGPAECSVLTTMGSLAPDVSPQNIGVGLGCRTWITDKDDHNRLMSIGCIGELCVEGPIVTKGYHNNGVMTANSYITNPGFAEQLGLQNMRIYKTGDLVRYESNGSLLIIGRKDTQIKIHGRRIECGEVEHHIVANGFPVDCVVVERIYEGGNETKPALAAFIKLGSGAHGIHQEHQLAIELSTSDRRRLSDLRQTLSNLVQPYMVPTLFVTLKNIPLTQTGKKDRKRLRRLGAELSPSQLEQYRLNEAITRENGDLACSTASEFHLRALWEEVLGLAPESIHAYDNFLQKGGDSIRAIALTSAARRTGKTLTVGEIFRYPRLHEMAKCLKNEAAAFDQDVSPFALVGETSMIIDHAAQECNVQKEIIQDIYPCTPLQEGLMAISTRVPDAYVATRVFDVPQSIDLDAFKQAWERAVEMFPILRTRIILGPEMEALQVVLNEQLAWGEINGSVKTYLAQSSLSQIEYGRPLSSYAISTRSRKFVWISHHALYDGFSAAKLLSTVEMLYGGKPVPATPNFNKFIQYLTRVDTGESDDFWRKRLSGGSPSSFPRLPSSAYHPRPNSELLCSFTLPHNETSGILKATVLRAAWSLVVSPSAPVCFPC